MHASAALDIQRSVVVKKALRIVAWQQVSCEATTRSKLSSEQHYWMSQAVPFPCKATTRSSQNLVLSSSQQQALHARATLEIHCSAVFAHDHDERQSAAAF